MCRIARKSPDQGHLAEAGERLSLLGPGMVADGGGSEKAEKAMWYQETGVELERQEGR